MKQKKSYASFLRTIFVFLSLSVIFTTSGGLSCKKGDEETKPSTNVTDQDIMSNNGKRWMVRIVTLTTYNSAGNIESEEDIDIGDNIGLWFGDNGGVNGLNKIFSASEPLLEYFPFTASWSLNTATQKITVTCLPGYCTPNKSGEWHITSFENTIIGSGHLAIERTISLPDGKKQKQAMILFLA